MAGFRQYHSNLSLHLTHPAMPPIRYSIASLEKSETPGRNRVPQIHDDQTRLVPLDQQETQHFTTCIG